MLRQKQQAIIKRKVVTRERIREIYRRDAMAPQRNVGENKISLGTFRQIIHENPSCPISWPKDTVGHARSRPLGVRSQRRYATHTKRESTKHNKLVEKKKEDINGKRSERRNECGRIPAEQYEYRDTIRPFWRLWFLTSFIIS